MTDKAYCSCRYVEGALAFFHDSLRYCCVLHHGRGALPLYDKYDGGPLPLEYLVEARAAAVAVNRGGGCAPACVGCPERKVRVWETKEFPIDGINFSHFKVCNLRCNYCYLQRGAKPATLEEQIPYDVLPAVKSLIAGRLLAPGASIEWGGGEPTLLPNFAELVSILSAHGCRQELNTNATIFSPVLHRLLIEDPRLWLRVSIDAGDAATYKSVKGRNLFDPVVENLRRYAEKSCGDILLKIVFLEENAHAGTPAALMEVLRYTGIKKLVIDIDLWNPNPSDRVKACIAMLYRLAVDEGISVKLGACGAWALPEIDLKEIAESGEKGGGRLSPSSADRAKIRDVPKRLKSNPANPTLAQGKMDLPSH